MLCHDCSRGMIYCGSCDEKEYKRFWTKLKDYEIIIPADFFGREISRFVRAKSAGEAKYNYWLDYADAYGDMKFGEFVKKIKVRRVP
jgi:hypothetical protein